MKGILLVNLGSPDSTDSKDVKKYLDQFLMDERVIDVNPLLRNILVRGVILRKRPKRSAAAYRKIWWDEGSPLVTISQNVKTKLSNIAPYPVALGMRYGNPSIAKGMKELAEQGVQDIILIPMYPQYSMSATETVVVEAQKEIKKYNRQITLHIAKPFYSHLGYTAILSEVIRKNIPKEYDKILFSYHGIPQRHLMKYDPQKRCTVDSCCFEEDAPQHKYCYRHQCYQNTKFVKQFLNLEEGKVMQSFQSRLGKDPWLLPYTDLLIEELPKKGIEKLVVVCPAFVSDCLETLEEINIEARKSFLEHGGKEFTYIPCINDSDSWVQLLLNIAEQAYEELYDIPNLKYSL